MGAELTLYTGCQGDSTLIHVSWFDQNNVRCQTDIEIRVLEQDKPRVLEILVDNLPLTKIVQGKKIFERSMSPCAEG